LGAIDARPEAAAQRAEQLVDAVRAAPLPRRCRGLTARCWVCRGQQTLLPQPLTHAISSTGHARRIGAVRAPVLTRLPTALAC
jgi:hypothetical protein